MKMDVIKLLLNEDNCKKVCFMCFQESENILGIDDSMEICDENSVDSTTLRNITNYLLPFYDILANQACQHCTKLIIEMYTSIKRGLAKIEEMKKHTDQIYKELELKAVLTNEINKNNVFPSVENKKLVLKINTETELNKEFSLKKSPVSMCDICGRLYKNPTHLKTHLKSHDKINCPCCKEIVDASYMKSHIKSHTKSHQINTITNFQCNECEYKTINKLDLTSHINKVHLKIRPYVCHMCQKAFFSSKNLKGHMSIHNKDKTVICDVCGEQYSYRRTLELHMRSHVNYRPHKCSVCGHKFVSISQKNEHIKRIHSPKELECNLCDKKYGIRKELTRHLKIVHKVISKSEVKSKMKL